HVPAHLSSILLPPRPPSSTLFPYTTLFRSQPPPCRPSSSSARRCSGLPCFCKDQAGAGPEFPPRPGLPAGGPRRSQQRVSAYPRSEEHTSELQSRFDVVCRLLLDKKKRGCS